VDDGTEYHIGWREFDKLREEKMNNREKLTEIASNVLNIKKEQVKFDELKENIESWDSFAHLALLSTVEEEMGVSIPFEEVAEVNTLEELLKKINEG
jgi:acyl carrier protein